MEKAIPQNVFIPLVLDVTHFLSALGELGARGDGGKGSQAPCWLKASVKQGCSHPLMGSGKQQICAWVIHWFCTTHGPHHHSIPSSIAPWEGQLERLKWDLQIEKENNTLRGKKKKKALLEMKSGF